MELEKLKCGESFARLTYLFEEHVVAFFLRYDQGNLLSYNGDYCTDFRNCYVPYFDAFCNMYGFLYMEDLSPIYITGKFGNPVLNHKF
jgi:hypothetical protein